MNVLIKGICLILEERAKSYEISPLRYIITEDATPLIKIRIHPILDFICKYHKWILNKTD